MWQFILSMISGGLFGLGLWLSGMTNPKKVIGFLDINGQFGPWQPALIFVMLSAILIAMPAFYWIKKRHKTLLNESIHLPTNHIIDRPLIIGSILFGLGWGLVGICPGPAIALFAAGRFEVIWFLIPMLVGLFIGKKINS